MGCGKSSVGRKLAHAFSYDYIDTDDLIEQRAGETISEIFKRIGEIGFRKMENEAVQNLLSIDKKSVISTGGGLPLREENRKILQQIGCIFYLKASPDTIYHRIKDDDSRPLLAVENPKERIRTLLSERDFHYETAADIVIDTNHHSYYYVIRQIEKQLQKRQKANKS